MSSLTGLLVLLKFLYYQYAVPLELKLKDQYPWKTPIKSR